MQRPIPFGKYYLLERINVGGMAEVFKAKVVGVEGFERLVAVKRILPSIAEDQEFIRMFIDEAKIAVQLSHANIAQVFDLGREGNSYYIALEYVSGRDLRTLFETARRNREPISPAQACFVMMKVCEGLDYAHNRKDPSGRDLHIVHRDVSPQNILLSYDGDVKIIDFGIAKAAGRASRTAAGILKGKFGYMSPEQVRGLPIDRRSDIFSVGVILYELLTLERLFVGESDFSTLEKVRNVEILPPSTYRPDIPEALENIILKALSRDPDDRHQSAADLHDELQQFLYSTGRVYSRKDLASYMRRTFAAEIREEAAKLEEYRRLPALPPTPPPARLLTPGPSFGVPGVGNALPPVPGSLHHRPVPTPSPGAAGPVPPPAGGSPALPDSPPFPLGPAGSRPVLPVAAAAGQEPAPTPRERPASGSEGGSPPGSPGEGASTSGGTVDLSWDEDEIETTVYDRTASRDGDHGPRLEIEWSLATDGSSAASRGVKSPPTASGTGPVLPGGGPSLADSPGLPPAVDPWSPEGGSDSRPVQGWSPAGKAAFLGAVTAVSILVAAIIAYTVLERRVRRASLEVRSVPEAVEILLDGQQVHRGFTPVRLGHLTPGRHQIVLRREGFSPEVRNIQLAPGRAHRLDVTLVPREGPAAAGLRLLSRPAGAVVEVDGQVQERRTPLLLDHLPPGAHTIRVTAEGHAPWSGTVVVEEGRTVERLVDLGPRLGSLAVLADVADGRFRVLGAGGRLLGEGPVPGKVAGVPVGTDVTVEVTRPGMAVPWRRTFRVEDRGGQEQRVEVHLATTAPGVTAGGAGLAAPSGPGHGVPGGEEGAPEGGFPSGQAAIEGGAPERRAPVAELGGGGRAGGYRVPSGGRGVESPASGFWQGAGAGRGGGEGGEVWVPGGGGAAGETGSPVGGELVGGTGRGHAAAADPAAPVPGFLRVNSKPWAKVIIDGKVSGQSTPLLNYPMAPGKHRVTLVNESFGIYRTFEVEIHPGRTQTLIVDLQ